MFKHISYLFVKELRIQMRSKNTLILMFIFSVLILLILCFAFGPVLTPISLSDEQNKYELAELAGSMLWIAFAFSGIIALGKSFDIDQNRATKALRLTGIVSTNIYLAKVISNMFLLFLLEIMITPITLVFLGVLSHLSLLTLLKLIVIFFFGTFGFCAGGSLLAAITINADTKKSLLTAILFPLLIPVLIAASKSTITILKNQSLMQDKWLIVLVGFSLLLFGISYLTFGFVFVDRICPLPKAELR